VPPTPPVYRPAALVRAELEGTFQKLKNVRWKIRSPQNDRYQCIAWAACRTDCKVWPNPSPPETCWPESVDPDNYVENFVAAFATFGYEPCGNDVGFELGYQKVAIYADENREVQHMARQGLLGSGWLSKIGDYEDILHPDVYCLESDLYGHFELALRRPWRVAISKLSIFQCVWHTVKFWFYRLIHPSWNMKEVQARPLR